MEEKPENFFNIEDSENTFLKDKEEISLSPNNENVEEILIEKRDMKIDDLKSLLEKNNIKIDEKKIENYFNQIVENKTYVNEYNSAISEIKNTKKEFFEKKGEGETNKQDPIIIKKLSELEENLANLNVEKQKKEDEIKSIINNIFSENIENIENIENKNFKAKNETLNIALNGVQEEKKKKNNFLEENKPTTNDVEENNFLEENKPTTNDVEENNFLEENKLATNDVEENNFLEENKPTTNDVEENNFLEENKPTTNDVEEKLTKKGEIKTEPSKDVNQRESLGLNKEETIEKIEEKNPNKTEESISSLSETMKKGFNDVLNAIKGIKTEKNDKTYFEEEKKTSQSEIRQNNEKTEESVKNKQKVPQANYLEEYKDSLRSNSPIGAFVGIKDIKFKANNIGSYT